MFPFLRVNTVMLTIILFAILWQQLCDIPLLVLWGRQCTTTVWWAYAHCVHSSLYSGDCFLPRLPWPILASHTLQSEWTVNVLQSHSLIVIRQCHLCKSFSRRASVFSGDTVWLQCTHAAIVLATASHFVLSSSFILSYRYHFLRLHCTLVILPALAVSLFKPSSLILFLFLLLLLHYS